MQNNTSKIRWITTTAIFIALLVALQGITKSMGQYVTGSMVNMILVVATLTAGTAAGATVALLSPVFAFMLGIGPAFVQMVPFVALGNLVLVLVWGYICGQSTEIKKMGIALSAGAVLKFAALYLGIVKFAVPVLLALPEPKAAVVGAAFSWPQLITAAIGGFIALLIVPTLKKALRK